MAGEAKREAGRRRREARVVREGAEMEAMGVRVGGWKDAFPIEILSETTMTTSAVRHLPSHTHPTPTPTLTPPLCLPLPQSKQTNYDAFLAERVERIRVGDQVILSLPSTMMKMVEVKGEK